MSVSIEGVFLVELSNLGFVMVLSSWAVGFVLGLSSWVVLEGGAFLVWVEEVEVVVAETVSLKVLSNGGRAGVLRDLAVFSVYNLIASHLAILRSVLSTHISFSAKYDGQARSLAECAVFMAPFSLQLIQQGSHGWT